MLQQTVVPGDGSLLCFCCSGDYAELHNVLNDSITDMVSLADEQQLILRKPEMHPNVPLHVYYRQTKAVLRSRLINIRNMSKRSEKEHCFVTTVKKNIAL